MLRTSGTWQPPRRLWLAASAGVWLSTLHSGDRVACCIPGGWRRLAAVLVQDDAGSTDDLYHHLQLVFAGARCRSGRWFLVVCLSPLSRLSPLRLEERRTPPHANAGALPCSSMCTCRAIHWQAVGAAQLCAARCASGFAAVIVPEHRRELAATAGCLADSLAGLLAGLYYPSS